MLWLKQKQKKTQIMTFFQCINENEKESLRKHRCLFLPQV